MVTREQLIKKDKGWRQAAADWVERAQILIDYMDGADTAPVSHPLSLSLPGKEPFKASDVVRRLIHLLDSLAPSVRAEERTAWDTYYAACRIAHPRAMPDALAGEATAMLEMRRKKFGQVPAEEPRCAETT